MHDEHFMERLDRLDNHHVTDALALYYDAELVRRLLHYARVGESCTRVAISLDDPIDGPFIIVSRDGHFVTALGRGMSAGPHPVVPRGAWDALRREQASIHEALAVARGHSRERARRVGKRLRLGGAAVSREDMRVLLPLANLFIDQSVVAYVEAYSVFMEAYMAAQSRVLWRSRGDELADTMARASWQCADNLVLLASSDVKKLGDVELADCIRVGSRPLVLVGAMMGPLLRHTWAVGKLGKVALPAYKTGLREGATSIEVVEAIGGLSAIGQRFSRRRGEVSKALRFGERVDESAVVALRRKLGRMAVATLDTSPDECRTLSSALGRYVRAEAGASQLSDAASMALVSSSSVDVVSSCDGLNLCAAANVRIGLLEAEELYLPEASIADVVQAPLVPPSLAWSHVRKAHTSHRPQRQRPSTPGRNEACACGSGRKYKRCCGALARAS